MDKKVRPVNQALFAFLLFGAALLGLAGEVYAMGKGKPPKDDPPPANLQPEFAYRVIDQQFKTSLFVAEADGSNATLVFSQDGVVVGPTTWLHDGSGLLFRSNFEEDGIYRLSLFDGSAVSPGVPDLIAPTNEGTGPLATGPAVMSPDGNWIAYGDEVSGAINGEEDIFVIPSDGSEGAINVTNTQDRFEGYPTWSPDSVQLAYVKSSTDASSKEIWMLDRTTPTNPTLLLASEDLAPGISFISHIDWSADGNFLVAGIKQESLDSQQDLWLVPLATPREPVRLTDTPEIDENWPSLSPDDGFEVVFERRADGDPCGGRGQGAGLAVSLTGSGVITDACLDQTLIVESGKRGRNTPREPDWRP
jgi:hypothetical protein